MDLEVCSVDCSLSDTVCFLLDRASFSSAMVIPRSREPPADCMHGHLFPWSHLRMGQGFGAQACCCKAGLLGCSAKDWVHKYNAGSSELSDAAADRLKLPRSLGLQCGKRNWLQGTEGTPNPSCNLLGFRAVHVPPNACLDRIQGKSSRTASPKDGVREEFEFLAKVLWSARRPYIPIRRSRWGLAADGKGLSWTSKTSLCMHSSCLELHRTASGDRNHSASRSGIPAVSYHLQTMVLVQPYRAYGFKNRLKSQVRMGPWKSKGSPQTSGRSDLQNM